MNEEPEEEKNTEPAEEVFWGTMTCSESVIMTEPIRFTIPELTIITNEKIIHEE